MIGFLVQGRVRIKIRFMARVRVGVMFNVSISTGAIVTGANVVHSIADILRLLLPSLSTMRRDKKNENSLFICLKSRLEIVKMLNNF